MGGGGDRDGGLAAAWVIPAAAAGVVVLLVVVAFGFVGVGRARGQRPAPTDASRPSAVADDEPLALTGPAAAFDAVVNFDADDQSLRPPPVVTGVAPGSLVEVRGRGFLGDAEGTVAQCPSARAARCKNLYRVRTDDEGTIRTQVRLVAGPTSLVLEVDLDRAASTLVFGDRASDPPQLTVDGRALALSGAEPLADYTIKSCPVDATSLERCSIAGRLRSNAGGSAELPIEPGRNDRIVVVVDAGENIVAGPRALAGRPGPAVVHSPKRLLTGLSLSLALLGVAVVLIRSTDWRVAAEAATPFLDAAALDG